MKFFVDTANLSEIREASNLSVLDGVTTNPSLIAEERRDFKELLTEICTLVSGPVSAEVIALDADGMLKEAREPAKLADNIVVKIPLTVSGLQTVAHLRAEDIKTNVTLCFSSPQALMAAKAGASYISPFIGRLDDIGSHGMDLVKQIITIYRNYDLETRVLVASVRHPIHIIEAALAGADVVTMPFKVLDQLIKHPLTDIGLERFLADWKKMEKPE
jgi:transaldolase